MAAHRVSLLGCERRKRFPTLSSFATRTGQSRTFLNDIERGEALASPAAIAAIADTLGIAAATVSRYNRIDHHAWRRSQRQRSAS